MRKYSDFFFGQAWPKSKKDSSEFSKGEWEFVDAAKDYGDRVGRFKTILLRRNISMEVFNSACYDFEFEFRGRIACIGCVVPEVTWLRDQAMQIKQAVRSVEEEIKSGNPLSTTLDLDEYYHSAEFVKRCKVDEVKLKFLEEMGAAEGKKCDTQNLYLCPYGAESEVLIKDGLDTKSLWKIVEFYDFHWNRSSSIEVSQSAMKWYHFDEPSIIDVTSYEDVIKAFEDGRIKRIAEEHTKFQNEFNR
jgi:hypothetical protein